LSKWDLFAPKFALIKANLKESRAGWLFWYLQKVASFEKGLSLDNNNSTIYRLTKGYSKTLPERPTIPKELYPCPDLLTLWTSNRIRAFFKDFL
jgi:hypothetical protein